MIRLRTEETIAFKEEMQEAFQHGFMAYYKDDNQWQILPDKDFYQSLEAEGAEAYEAIDTDGQRVGGAIIAIDAAKHHGELSFLYVKVGVQSKGILHQPLRFPCRRILQRASSRPTHARAI